MKQLIISLHICLQHNALLFGVCVFLYFVNTEVAGQASINFNAWNIETFEILF